MNKVVCNRAKLCPEHCGGKEPHYYEENECGKCPLHPEAECLEVETKQGDETITLRGQA